MSHRLRLQWVRAVRGEKRHLLTPPAHLVLCGFKKRPVALFVQHGVQAAQYVARIAHKATLHRMTKPNALRVEIDLDCLDCPGIRVKFDIGKSRSDNQQRVAVFHDFLGWCSAQDTDTAGGVWVVIIQGRLAEKRLRHRCAQQFRALLQLVARFDSTAPGQDSHPFSVVEQAGGLSDKIVSGFVAVREPFIRNVPRQVSPGSAFLFCRLFLRVVGDRKMRHTAAGESGPAGKAGDIFHMCRVADNSIVDADIFKDPCQVNILLREGFD